MTDTSQKLLRAALKRFEEAVRLHENKGSKTPAEFEEIDWEYTDAMRSLYTRLGLKTPRVRKEKKEKVHSGRCARHQGGFCNCVMGMGVDRQALSGRSNIMRDVSGDGHNP